MLKNLLYKITFGINSYVRMNVLTNVRFYWHTMEWTGYVLFALAGLFFIASTAWIYQMIIAKSDTNDIKCLATNIYHEARGEPLSGKYAVSLVTLNRVKSTKYPDNVCQVVYQQTWSPRLKRYIAAFSWTAQSPNPNIEKAAWEEAIKIAKKTYYEDVNSKAKDALFYHADYVTPRWASEKIKITKIGRHIFYK